MRTIGASGVLACERRAPQIFPVPLLPEATEISEDTEASEKLREIFL